VSGVTPDGRGIEPPSCILVYVVCAIAEKLVVTSGTTIVNIKRNNTKGLIGFISLLIFNPPYKKLFVMWLDLKECGCREQPLAHSNCIAKRDKEDSGITVYMCIVLDFSHFSSKYS
jgi:hypothetical protein